MRIKPLVFFLLLALTAVLFGATICVAKNQCSCCSPDENCSMGVLRTVPEAEQAKAIDTFYLQTVSVLPPNYLFVLPEKPFKVIISDISFYPSPHNTAHLAQAPPLA